ncbi:hypothetical protein POTOM_012444 [Populus tomentosa]|uniref:Uncharacterized protein n=1 Tax=Populus tomentosa TaxID=118781 RepID=A0A8X8A7B4_POPTO|nr:hypothetical protein POTOM_012444 [Populus tomentosa]
MSPKTAQIRLVSSHPELCYCYPYNNDPHMYVFVRKKGYASRIVVQRSTEEESLHVIKFWRDSDIQMDAKEISTTNKSVPARVMDPLVS